MNIFLAISDDRKFILTKWLIFWSLLTFVGLLFVGSFYVGRTSSGQPVDILNALNSQLLRFQVWAVMSFLIVWLNQKLRAVSHNWLFLFPALFAGGLIWSLLSTCLFIIIYWGFEGVINKTFSSFAETFQSAWVSNLVVGIVGYKIILTTNYAIDYYRQFQSERNRTILLEKQLAQSQLQALKMQLQPHFLFNTLNSISNLTLENPRMAVQMIARLGDFLRLTIDANGTQEVTLEREVEFLKCYLEIEQIRFQDRLKVEINLAPETLDAKVPNLILQPLVENAVKHGISKKITAEKISIKASQIGENLQLKIENDGQKILINGNGLSEKGIGLANTRQRLRQIFQDDFRLDLIPLEKGGASVVLEIPFRG
jgi:sensor histidine kinase YesM